MTTELNTARDCVSAIKDGSLRSVDLVKTSLAEMERTDSTIKAWQHLDNEQAIAAAEQADEQRRHGRPVGQLQGIPVGLKDIIDTAELPTEYGSPIYKGRQADQDAAIVEKLKESGAVILGKTVTTEFAFMHPANTRNPHNTEFGPGGSSSGSAAAVAAGHVPLAFGTQTNGSVIRPASYCGVYGFKPSRGVVSRRGILQTSASLDQPGMFARDLGDLALLADIVAGYDASDSVSYNAPKPAALDGYLQDVPVEPNFVWLELPYADRFSDALVQGADELISELGGQIERVTAPASFNDAIEAHSIIYDYEIFRCLSEVRTHESQLSDTVQSAFERAEKRTEEEYQQALAFKESFEAWFKPFFNDYDAVLTASAPSEAPRFGEGTGDPICCTVWTLAGLPCLNLPLLAGDHELPIGIQLVGAHQEDDRLFRSARWLLETLHAQASSTTNTLEEA